MTALSGVPTASWLLLAGTGVGMAFTLSAWRPLRLPNPLALPSFFAGWLANELALHHIVWQVAATGVLVGFGALQAWPGWLALGLALTQWVLNALLVRDAFAAREVAEAALRHALGDGYAAELPDSGEDWFTPRWSRLVVPFRFRHPAVRRERNRVYARVAAKDLTLDVFRPRADGQRRPVAIYVHGGGWVLGYRDRQGIPFLTEMAARGWIGIQPSYRLSPLATYPDHAVDIKRVIAWVREHAVELGADPDFIAVAGGSAGGHLAAIAGLTGNVAAYQPGFEDADTSVQACVPFYGVYDPDDTLGHQLPDMTDFLARVILKADPDEDPERWALMSPLRQITPDAPAFLVIHGARDTLTPPEPAAAFADRLGQTSGAPSALVMLPAAQHAFDVFPSIRTAIVVRAVARFLAVARARALAAALPRPGGTADTRSAP